MSDRTVLEQNLINAVQAFLDSFERGAAMPLPASNPSSYVAIGTSELIRRLLPPLTTTSREPLPVNADELGQLAYLSSCVANDQTPLEWDNLAEADKCTWRITAVAISRLVARDCAKLADGHDFANDHEVARAIRSHYDIIERASGSAQQSLRCMRTQAVFQRRGIMHSNVERTSRGIPTPLSKSWERSGKLAGGLLMQSRW